MVNYNGGLDTLTEIKFGVFNFLPLGSQPEFCRSKISLTHPWLYPPHLPEAQDDCFGKLSNFIFPTISVLPIVPQRCFLPTYNHCSSWDESNPPWRSLTGGTIQCRIWRHYFPIKIMEQLQPALQHYKNLWIVEREADGKAIFKTCSQITWKWPDISSLEAQKYWGAWVA